jgi:hypothetical protein
MTYAPVRPWGRCAVCGRKWRLRVDGTMAAHGKPLCAGTGKPPAPERTT